MNTHALLRAPYRLARLPLTVVESRLVALMANDSPPRLAFERALGSLDMVAGRLLRDDRLTTSGVRLLTRAEDLSEATRLETDAAARRSAAAETRRHAAQHADELREQADEQQRSDIHETAVAMKDAKRQARLQVETQAKGAKQRSEDRAELKRAAARQKQKAVARKANAEERRAKAEASETIAQAAQKKRQARARRADAGKLAELSDAKQNARKTTTTPRSTNAKAG